MHGDTVTGSSEWTGRVGTSWSQEWRRTDRSFGTLTPRLLDEVGTAPFSCALDIGCGAGEVSLALARAHPSAEVVGVDISGELLAVARRRGEGVNGVRFVEGDAAATNLAAARPFDLLVSRHGVMFFADPVAAFSHLRSLCAPAARLVFSCFRPLAENAWAKALGAVAGAPTAPPDPAAPGPFAFGDRARVEQVLGEAGWTGVGFEAVDYAMIASEGGVGRDAALDDAVGYFLRIGPGARAIADLDPAARDDATARLRETLARHYTDGRVSLPAAAWIVTARAL